ncbi:T7SS effector LXG polymorphic toxin [Bacillus marasmi]|uniref:T7SS effector LXG polymorphic toxin n=1 Tax=Bacillus marasmi TaxID=1926279 RepID=UPI0011CB3990|nr:T7SS effector LXG polymorphic toxin [Bacillus marasmi]
MSYLKIYESSTLLSSISERIKDYKNLQEQLEDLKGTFQEIVQLSDFKGKTADAIKGFYLAQIDVVNAWEDFIDQHLSFLKSVEGAVSERNLSGNTLVHVPFLEETLKKAAQKSNEIVSEKESELKRIFRNIDDIISLDVFSSAEFDQQMYLAEKERKDTLEKVHELDYDLVNQYQKSLPAESYAKLLFQQLLQSSTKNGAISPIHFNSKAYHSSEIYRAKKPRSISKEEFENIQHKLAYQVQIIDEYGEYGGDFYVFDNGQIVRKYTARVKGKFVTRFEIVEKIPKNDRTGGVKELGSSYEGTPLEPLEYVVNPKSLAIKGGKRLFGKGLNDIGESLTIKLEKPELSTAWAHSGYGENFLHIKKSVDVSSPVVNKVVDDVRDVTKSTGEDSKGISELPHVKEAKDIIAERTKGLDLKEHPTTTQQMSSKKMKELKDKIDNRTITKQEYADYIWNKKFAKRRDKGVKEFWYQEQQRLLNNEPLTRDWSQEQLKDILAGKTPKYDGKPIAGHHTYSASKYPHLADRGEIIYPATFNEHLKGWHGGNWRNSIPGEPIIPIKNF